MEKQEETTKIEVTVKSDLDRAAFIQYMEEFLNDLKDHDTYIHANLREALINYKERFGP